MIIATVSPARFSLGALLAVLGGLALGCVTNFLQGVLPDALQAFSNSGSVWGGRRVRRRSGGAGTGLARLRGQAPRPRPGPSSDRTSSCPVRLNLASGRRTEQRLETFARTGRLLTELGEISGSVSTASQGVRNREYLP